MPIAVQDIISSARAALDAEGADHYNDTLDFIPAINDAVRWTVTLINATLGQKKPGEEALRDLTVAQVFRTSQDSRLSLAQFPEEVWTIMAIEVLPVTRTTGAAVPAMPNNKQSYYRPDLYHIRGTKPCARLTIEEWRISVSENPWAPGYNGSAICDGIKEYAYLNPVTYNPDNTVSITNEIELSPALDKQLVTVFYAQKPDEVTTVNDNIPFPFSMYQLILARTLQYISWKQGDGTNLFSVTQNDINTLLKAIN